MGDIIHMCVEIAETRFLLEILVHGRVTKLNGSSVCECFNSQQVYIKRGSQWPNWPKCSPKHDNFFSPSTRLLILRVKDAVAEIQSSADTTKALARQKSTTNKFLTSLKTVCTLLTCQDGDHIPLI